MSSEAGQQRARDGARYLPGVLVEPAWLEEGLDAAGLRTVDLRDADAYESAHIPGAVHLELRRLGTSFGGTENVVLAPSEFGDLMASLGISNGDAVVAYDDQWGLAAARLLWALHYYGHDEVAVLNGGWDRWLVEGRGSATGREQVAPGSFSATPRTDVYARTDWILERIGDPNVVLIDTRTEAEFEAGHIPGAISWDWFNAVPSGDADVSRDPAELRAEWRQLGLEPSHEVTVYCRSGMRAAHTYLVLRNAGFSRVRLYDGSWQEWSMTMEGTDGP